MHTIVNKWSDNSGKVNNGENTVVNGIYNLLCVKTANMLIIG